MLTNLRFPFTVQARLGLLCFALGVSSGCGETKAPVMDDDSEAIRALKAAGAQVMRLPVPGGMAADEPAVRVELDDVNVDGDIIQHLNDVPMLMELKFGKATDEQLKSLGDFKALTKLDLSGSEITDEGLSHLAGKSLPSLTTLMLDDTRITGAGLAEIPAHVGGLTLSNVPLADADLENLRHLRKLSALTLTGTGISAAAVNNLRKQRPGLLVMGIKLN